MTRVLIFMDHYLPAMRVGGPVVTAASMAEFLTDYQFYIFASETDLGTDAVLEGIEVDQWQQRGRARVFYASAKSRTPFALRRIIRETKPDVICLFSFFSRRFTIPILVMRLLRLLPRVPIVVAPMGEFSLGALRLKSGRKRAYLWAARLIGLYKQVVWRAASGQEQDDIISVQGNGSRIVLAQSFPVIPHTDAAAVHLRKTCNRCKLVFLSRISRKKNLIGAIESLKSVHGNVEFDIYGPIEDADYWSECLSVMDRLPENITTSYRGAVAQGAAQEIFSAYDALFLPTQGENYGYVIVEAWAAATPVLISNRTPWEGLEDDHAGWSSAPDDHAAFAEHVDTLVSMDESEHKLWRDGALRRARALADNTSLHAAYARLFKTPVEKGKD